MLDRGVNRASGVNRLLPGGVNCLRGVNRALGVIRSLAGVNPLAGVNRVRVLPGDLGALASAAAAVRLLLRGILFLLPVLWRRGPRGLSSSSRLQYARAPPLEVDGYLG